MSADDLLTITAQAVTRFDITPEEAEKRALAMLSLLQRNGRSHGQAHRLLIANWEHLLDHPIGGVPYDKAMSEDASTALDAWCDAHPAPALPPEEAERMQARVIDISEFANPTDTTESP
ncbi:MAG: hypothetical protein PF961_16570 [Planctomycetota bacterium]|jgi:hypothetical protein|nr:hypothetical protein [Planctomycetota bacterium]